MHPLVFVSTPIGNLADLTFRALEHLKAADIIICEDTRHTRKLLTRYDVRADLLSFHDHSGTGRITHILQLVREGKRCVYVSDAGTPMISDPGFELARALIDADLPYDVVPGANAVLPALMLSGLPVEPFLFLGFLPRKESEIRSALVPFMGVRATLVAYQSPRRIRRTLSVLAAHWPERAVAVVKELTKVHQAAVRGLPADLLDRFSDQEKGEFVLVIGPPVSETSLSDNELRRQYHALRDAGADRRTATRYLAGQSPYRAKDLYEKSLAWDEEGS